MPSREEVALAYRLFLGREPESESAIAAHQAEEDLDRLGQRLMATDEFRRRLGRGGTAHSKWVCTEIRHGLKLWVDLTDSGVSAGCLKNNWEPVETDLLLSILAPGDTFIDVGANLGWFTILAANAVGPEGRVHAFEPRKDIYQRLLQSVRENGFGARCTVHPVAAGQEESEVDLAWIPDEYNPGHSFFVKGDLPEGAERLARVPILPLDSLEIAGAVRLIKIDVEGAEPQVLAGACRLIERDHPILLIEIFPRWLQAVSTTTPGELLDNLRQNGYRIFRLSAAGIGRELHQGDDGVESGEPEYFNILALPEADAQKMISGRLDQRVGDLERLLQAEKEAHAKDSLAAAAALKMEKDRVAAALHNEAYASRALESAQAEQRVAETLATAADRARTEAAAKLAIADSAIVRLRAEIETVSARLRMIEESTIWRATFPLRRISQHIPSDFRRAVRRAARLVWWTATLQLPRRIKTHLERSTAPTVQNGGSKSVIYTPSLSNALVARMPDGDSPAPRLPRPDRPRALIIDSRWPRPDRDSGSLDAVHQVRALLNFGYEVIFVGDGEFLEKTSYRTALQSEGVVCLGPEIAPSIESFLHSDGRTIDLVVLARVYSGGRYLEVVRRHAPRARVVFSTVDLHHVREEREARISCNAVALRRAEGVREREFYIARQADATIVVSAAERAMLEREIPGAAVFEMPLARDVRRQDSIPGFEARQGVGFVGGFEHLPNVDAARFLLLEIWPLVLERHPRFELTIVGAGLPPDIVTAAPRGVRYLGALPDLAPWLDGLRLTIAPLRYGAGAKGKVASSLAAGVPCVATPIAAEGMNLENDVEVAVAGCAEAIATKICEVHEDNVLWRRLSQGGHQKALRELSLAAGEERLANMLRAIEAPAPGAMSRVTI